MKEGIFNNIQELTQRPQLFESGDESIWVDPHIAKQMLALHINPQHDVASRKAETIDKIVDWIVKRCQLQADNTLLDLGCGPGLYCRRFSEKGLRVTGVDMSQTSIDYAREHDPQTTYICQNYTDLQVDEKFNAISLIYGDFCVLSDTDRDALLDKIYALLADDGYFTFDVTTPNHNASIPAQSWSVADEGGFWKPNAYIELSQKFDYPEHDTICQQYIILEPDQTTSRYRVWNHGYTSETIEPVLKQHGFTIEGIYGDLMGSDYDPDGIWMGIIARRS